MSHRIHDPKFLQARYRLNGNANDSSGHLRHGTLVNAPTWGVFNKGLKTCIELDGNNQYVNCGDLTCLNAVSAFTICFWMRQDVINAADNIFVKFLDASNSIYFYTAADTFMYFYLENTNTGIARTTAAYGNSVPALSWHHVAVVFDGAQAAANRLLVYFDGAPVALTIVSALPATTADLTGVDAMIGNAVSSFDGRLYDFRIYSCALSRQEIMTIQHDPIGVL